MWIIRKRIQLPSEKAIFLFVDKTVPQSRWAQRYTEILNTCTVLCGTPPPCHYCLFTLCFFNRPQISNIKPAIKHTCLVLWVTYCEALAFLTWYAGVRLSHMCVYLSISVRVSSSYVGNQSPCEGEATPELSIYTDLIFFFLSVYAHWCADEESDLLPAALCWLSSPIEAVTQSHFRSSRLDLIWSGSGRVKRCITQK